MVVSSAGIKVELHASQESVCKHGLLATELGGQVDAQIRNGRIDRERERDI